MGGGGSKGKGPGAFTLALADGSGTGTVSALGASAGEEGFYSAFVRDVMYSQINLNHTSLIPRPVAESPFS